MSQIDSISQACPDKGNETQVAPATGAVGDRWLQGWCVVERRGDQRSRGNRLL